MSSVKQKISNLQEMLIKYATGGCIENSEYAERRSYIWEKFRPVFEQIESDSLHPLISSINASLRNFGTEYLLKIWQTALSRSQSDPEGAITSARTLLEAACKHILDEIEIEYSHNSDLSELYKLTAKQLNLAPEQHQEQMFKKVLGNCSGVISGLGEIRNKLGDAHAQGKRSFKAQTRHAELAINLAGTMSQFLLVTHTTKMARI